MDQPTSLEILRRAPPAFDDAELPGELVAATPPLCGDGRPRPSGPTRRLSLVDLMPRERPTAEGGRRHTEATSKDGGRGAGHSRNTGALRRISAQDDGNTLSLIYQAGGWNHPQRRDSVTISRFSIERVFAMDSLMARSNNPAPPSFRCGLFALLLFMAASARAQHFHFSNFTADQGLASSQVWVIHQDRAGYLWFGTSNGVSRYDGFEFRNFTTADGLRTPIIRAITESSDGHLWFGTDDGISEFDGYRFRNYGEADGVPRGRVMAATRDGRGRLWFGTRGSGLLVYDGKRFRRFTDQDGLLNNEVDEVFWDRKRDGLWIAFRNHGVLLWTPGEDGSPRLPPRVFPGQLGVGSVRQIAEDRDGNVYFATRSSGVSRFDGNELKRLTEAEGLAGNNTYAVSLTPKGELVIGTFDAGASICKARELTGCRTLNTKNGLAADAVYSTYADREGNIWFGTRSGVSQLSTTTFQSFGEAEGLPNRTVYAVLGEPNGDLWVTTHAGLARLRVSGDSVHVDRITEATSVQFREMFDVLRDRNGTHWFASGRGLFRMRGDGRFEQFWEKHGLAETYVNDLFEDSRGALWIATSGGVSRLDDPAKDPLSFTNFGRAEGLPGLMIYSIAEDRDGRMWVASEGQGIAWFDGTRFHAFTTRDGLPGDAIHDLLVSRDGALWIGTAGGGLARVDPRSVTQRAGTAATRVFDRDDGLHSDDVISIAENRDGALWLTTSRGVDLFDPKSGSVIGHFEKDDGLAGNEGSGSNSTFIDEQGSVWFALTSGLTRYRPSHDAPVMTAPAAGLERVTIDGKRELFVPFERAATKNHPIEALTPGIRIPFTSNTVRFDFHILGFRDQRSAQISYQLEGFDPAWSPATAQRFKEYTNLPPGTYTFRLRARTAGGVWREASRRYSFTILEPFWATWWFRAAVLLFVTAMIALIYKVRTAHIRTRNRELEEVVATRTRELAEYSRSLEEQARELERANVEIRKADALKTKFLATMSHELRTPLNSIIGFSEILDERLRQSVDARELRFLRNVIESAYLLLNLINNLLDLSKLEAGMMELHTQPVALPPLIESVRSMLTGIATRRGIEIHTQAAGDLPLILADEPKVRQILYNLVSNAIKFSPPNSAIEVEASLAQSATSGEPIEIRVTDHGAGIELSQQSMIFEEFAQTEEGVTHGGTGLGLAISKRLAELHGGHLTVESRRGAGSTFKLALPLEEVQSRLNGPLAAAPN